MITAHARKSCHVKLMEDGTLKVSDDDQDLATKLGASLSGRAAGPFVACVTDSSVAVMASFGPGLKRKSCDQTPPPDFPFKKPRPVDARTMLGKIMARTVKEVLASEYDSRLKHLAEGYEEEELLDDEEDDDDEPAPQLPMTTSKGLPFRPCVLVFHVEGCVVECDPPKKHARALYFTVYDKIVQFFSKNHFLTPTKYSVDVKGYDDVTASMASILASTPVERKVITPQRVCNFNFDSQGYVTACARSINHFCRVREVQGHVSPRLLLKPLRPRFMDKDAFFCDQYACFTDANGEVFVVSSQYELQVDTTRFETVVGFHVLPDGEIIIVIGDDDNDATHFRSVTFSDTGCEEMQVFSCPGCATASVVCGSTILLLMPDDSVVVRVAKHQWWQVEQDMRVCHPNKPMERLLHLGVNSKLLCVVTRTAAVFYDRETGEMRYFTAVQGVDGISGFGDDWLVSTGEGLCKWHVAE